MDWTMTAWFGLVGVGLVPFTGHPRDVFMDTLQDLVPNDMLCR